MDLPGNFGNYKTYIIISNYITTYVHVVMVYVPGVLNLSVYLMYYPEDMKPVNYTPYIYVHMYEPTENPI